MTSLDEPINYIDPNEVSPQNTIVRFGVIGGLVLVIYSLIGFLTGVANLSMGLIAFIIYFVIIIVLYSILMVFAVKNHRDKELGGSITLKRAFIVAFLVGIIIALISTFFSYIYINFIDPDYLNSFANNLADWLQSFGVPEDQIDEAQLDDIKAEGSFTAQLKNLAWGSVVGALVSLIIAAIMKKEPPQSA